MVTAAKRILFLLFLAGTAPAEPETTPYEIAAPKSSDDWERLKPDLLESNWDGGAAMVQVMVLGDRKGELAAVAENFRTTLEAELKGERTTRAAELAGVPSHVVDIRAPDRHVTWELARKGSRLYVLMASRVGNAVDDEDVENEIAEIRASFRVLPEAESEAPGPAVEKPAEKPPEPAKAYDFEYWLVRLWKPEGFVEKELDESEKRAGVILRVDAERPQSRCMIRVYAMTKSSRHYRTLAQLAKRRVAEYEKRYEKRQPPGVVPWKPKLAKDGTRIHLVGKRRTTETTRWHLAECRNKRQYQVEVFVRGAWADWTTETDAFLARFEPRNR